MTMILDQMLLGTRQAWCFHHFPGEPVPVTDHPLHEEPFPEVQSKLSLMQLYSISSSSIAHPQTEISAFSATLPEEVVNHDEVCQPSLVSTEHAK